jgi:hypothetical protein
MLNVPYIGPIRLTRGASPSLRTRFLARLAPNSVHSQNNARSAHCHWSSSMVRGMKRSRLLPSGVTPPPIISAMLPVTTTAGRSWSWLAAVRRNALSVPVLDRLSSDKPVTATGSSCGGRPSV